ncbi:MAG: hypothetical protein ACFE9R_03220 [Candidatus Hermodarchaeota archaeon]
MVNEKLGPIISIIGSLVVIGFNIFLFIVYVNVEVYSGFELASIGFVTALTVGAIGLVGGLLALRWKRLANIMPLLAGVFAIVGIFIPIGEVGLEMPIPTSPYYTVVYTPVSLFWTYIYVDVISMCLGGALGLLIKPINQFLSKKAQVTEKRDNLLYRIEKLICNYLETNKGKAFTAQSIHNRCIEANQLTISILETEKIINNLYSLGKCHLDVKEDAKYYYIP